jgi:hypothetical protein
MRKLYTGKKLLKAGQEIELVLPFSNGEYVKEYLVNVQFLTKTFEKYQMHLVETYRMTNTEGVSETDMKHLSLYGVLKYMKK